MQTVQIPLNTFLQLHGYFCMGVEPTDEFKAIRDALESKFDSMVRRYYYNQYKTAPTPEEREQARQEYLNSIGALDSFRY